MADAAAASAAMPASPTADVVALLRGDRAHWRRVYEFNLLPSRYIHPTWADQLFAPELWRRLAGHRRSEPALSRMILEDLGIADTFVARFEGTAARLALLDGAALERLCRHVGLVVAGAPLRRIIDRDHVAAVRARLGEESYAFAVQRAPLLAAQAGPVAVAPGDGDPEALLAQVEAAGRRTLVTLLAGLPPPLHKRLALKLPWSAAAEAAALRAPEAEPIVLRVIKETEPQWASWFAPQTA